MKNFVHVGSNYIKNKLFVIKSWLGLQIVMF